MLEIHDIRVIRFENSEVLADLKDTLEKIRTAISELKNCYDP